MYPVSSFDGEKAFVVSTTSPLGGKNDFLGWAYIAVGCLCLALGLLFGLKQKIAPRYAVRVIESYSQFVVLHWHTPCHSLTLSTAFVRLM